MAEEVELPENRMWPPPPPFYKQFTSTNVDQFKEIKQQALGDAYDESLLFDSKTSLAVEVPDTLRGLVPPEPPAEGQYRVFTEIQDVVGVSRTLQDENIEQLYPPHREALAPSQQPVDTEWTVDRVYYLKKLTRSIMLNFLELMGALSTDSSQYFEKFEHIRALFYNAHSVINDYRQHQARETLILMMEAQLEKKRAEVDEIRKMKEKINEIMKGLEDAAAVDNASIDSSGASARLRAENERRKKEQRSMWHALDAEMAI
ncbi:hypothetical protein NA57DRAFT_56984 [Rhizodiscina lignyota]|uniref:Mediator of RNA polymerase II transcription subunit 7 n=1 Tax=Rhizodiscina lignyota TaxID=1504668 RepID=A0A9P4IG02_9PEZI|nr:hypothetical protein NA57DRAFT_56984 [Rhizodiscina lignyota]